MEEFLHYILTTNISTMLLNKQLLVIKLSTGWLSETIYCCSGQVLKDSEKYYIDLLNDIIPGTVVRIILN